MSRLTTRLALGQATVMVVAGFVALSGNPAPPAAAAAQPAIRSVADALPRAAGHAHIRLAAISSALHDSRSYRWSPDDAYAVGGRLVASGNRIAGTATPFLYQHGRLGGRGYNIPVATPGTYAVDLFVAETRGAHRGERVWNVTAEGRPVARAVDVARQAGRNTAGHVLFRTAVLDGSLTLRLGAVRGEPLIGAVEVDRLGTSTVTRQLFEDDFTGPRGQPPSGLHWRYDIGGHGWGNRERQSYTARPRNASLDGNGVLRITARHERTTGPDGLTRPYSSARLKTAGRFSFRYGTAEARIKVPRGRGLWPAFWALGTNVDSVGWPDCGEIDVMENKGSQPRTIHATVRGALPTGGAWVASRPARLPTPLSAGFHTYRLTWSPSALGISIDGRTFMTINESDLPPGSGWPFDHKFHLLLDLAVGGTWPGPPGTSTRFPATMAVDYVRVRG